MRKRNLLFLFLVVGLGIQFFVSPALSQDQVFHFDTPYRDYSLAIWASEQHLYTTGFKKPLNAQFENDNANC